MKTIEGFKDWASLQISSRGKPYSIGSINSMTTYAKCVLRETESTVDTITIEKVIKFLAKYSTRTENRNAGFVCYNNYLTALRLLERYIGRTFTEDLKFIKIELPDITNRMLKLTELKKLRKNPYVNIELLALISFSYDTGCRIREALKLDDENLNLSKRLAKFCDTKNGKDRVVTFTLQTAKLIQLHLLTANRTDWIEKRRDKIWGRVGYRSYSRRLKKAICMVCPEDLHGRSISLHSLRHSRAHYLTSVGTNIKAIKDQFGWSNYKMLDRYASLTLEDREYILKEADVKIKKRFKI